MLFGGNRSVIAGMEEEIINEIMRFGFLNGIVNSGGMLGDQPIIVEVYNPQLSGRFAEGQEVHMTLVDRCVRVLK